MAPHRRKEVAWEGEGGGAHEEVAVEEGEGDPGGVVHEPGDHVPHQQHHAGPARGGGAESTRGSANLAILGGNPQKKVGECGNVIIQFVTTNQNMRLWFEPVRVLPRHTEGDGPRGNGNGSPHV